MRHLAFPILIAFVCLASAQESKHVLFVGNSYTYVNNLPQMIADMATSVGDELIHTSNTPGGCTFQEHCSNQSMVLIRQGGWDAVVLQEQSQYPSFPQWQVENEVFPYARQLVDAIYAYSPCAEPMFYMTWGRRDGDQGNAAAFPVLGTYEGMDSMLCLRYTQMAADNDASLCPVGRVWRLLRSEHPEIELYADDGSHPSLAGTYAAACAFFAMLFHHDPSTLTYNGGLQENTAAVIRSAASSVVWSAGTGMPLSQWTRPLPHGSLESSANGEMQVLFTNLTTFADSLLWSFGDGTTLTTTADIDTLSHTYPDTGVYSVTLVALRHCMSDTVSIDVRIDTDSTSDDPVGLRTTPESAHSAFVVYPSPTRGLVTIESPSPSHIEVVLLSMSGKTMLLSDSRQVDLSSLPKGIYLLCLRQDGIEERHKIVKM